MIRQLYLVRDTVYLLHNIIYVVKSSPIISALCVRSVQDSQPLAR